MSFFGLPLKDKKLLKQWIHAIGRKNLYLNKHTGVCSRHFVNANKRLLRPDEVPTLELPQFSTPSSHRKPPKECSTSVAVDMPLQHSESPTELEIPITKNVQVQTEINGSKFDNLTNEVSKLECTVENQRFCLSNVSKDESKLCFYTEFTSFAALMACYNFLGPAVNSLL